MRKGMNNGERLLVRKVGEWVAGLLKGEVSNKVNNPALCFVFLPISSGPFSGRNLTLIS